LNELQLKGYNLIFSSYEKWFESMKLDSSTLIK